MKSRELAVSVSTIIERVKKDGDGALVYYCRKFDKINLQTKNIKILQREIDAAAAQLDPALRRAIEKAARNIEKFHRMELKHIARSWFSREGDSVTGRTVTAIATVGIYVPGGRFSYPSTVLMAAIPARVAGASRVVMVTPPARLTPAVLFAAKVAKVDEIYQVGGPAAIAALAYGTKTVPAVDIIVGPGNAYVNEAKRQVFGKVGIDSLAGPSEVAIIADKTARVAYVLADMAAQAEHDPAAKAYLLTDSEELLSEVKKKLPRQIAAQTELIFCRMDEAVERVNELAPEHLEIMTKNAAMLAKKVKNAGAVFVGQYTPTAIGDYWAGPSHILPTAGTARFSSVLSVETFLKRTSYISYGAKAVEKAALQIETLARAEGLEDHRNSVVVRRK